MINIVEEIIEEEYKKNGLRSLKESIEIGIPSEIKKQAEEKLKNYAEDYRDYKIKISEIQTNIISINSYISLEKIYDKKEDLIELGNMLINEAKKIIELGIGVKK